jgi:hypothetical protein
MSNQSSYLFNLALSNIIGVSNNYNNMTSNEMNVLHSRIAATNKVATISTDCLGNATKSSNLMPTSANHVFEASDVASLQTHCKPKRPLSAYNYFFQEQRQKILQQTPTRAEGKPRRSHGKIGFAPLARMIAAKWKENTQAERKKYDDLASADRARYMNEMDVYKENQKTSPLKTLQLHAAAHHMSETPSMYNNVQESRVQPSVSELLRLAVQTPLIHIEQAIVADQALSQASMQQHHIHQHVYISQQHQLNQLQLPMIENLVQNLDEESMDLIVSMFRV